jgi:hypothetical protein
MQEAAAFQVVLSGEFLLQGFRNRDIRRKLYPSAERREVERPSAGQSPAPMAKTDIPRNRSRG